MKKITKRILELNLPKNRSAFLFLPGSLENKGKVVGSADKKTGFRHRDTALADIS